MSQQESKTRDLRPEWSIFIPTMVLILLVGIPSLIWTEKAESILTKIYKVFSDSFGSSFLWMGVLLIVFCGFFAMSRWGDIKFGDPDEKPEYSLVSWVAMIFCTAVAGASMFWAIVEPQWNLLIPPQYAQPGTPEAYDWSLAYLLLHWGPLAWCSYFMCALPIAYFFHIKKKPFLRVSSCLENVIGKQVNGIFGRLIDIMFIIGLVFCTTATMIISLPTVEAAISTLTGIQPSFGFEAVILCVSCGIAGVSVYLGLKKGIARLSNLNIVIALFIIGFAFVAGPTAKIVDIFTNAVGKMLGNYMNMVFWTDPFTEGTFPQDWTIFYVLFWAAYGPFMGLFIARISRGRTVREIIGWGLVGTVGAGYLIHGVFGSYTLWLNSTGTLDSLKILQESGGPTSMMAVIGSLPLGKLLIGAYVLYSTIFLATSIDSSCYIVSSTVTTKMSYTDDPHRIHRVCWAVAQAILALGLLAIGGLGIAKMFGNFGGAFMAIPIVLLTISWFKILRDDGDRLLREHTDKKDCRWHECDAEKA
ncbi:MAG: BCCT family transporter [Mailhella sp.]|nr:BCCT family transporter [Mailhella sp.]